MARMNNRFDKPEDRLKRVKNWKREKGIKAGVKDKRRVWLPASPALRQIRYYQATTDLLIPQAPFQRIVRDIIQEQHGATLRMQTDALGALQVATEQYLVDLFTGAMRLSIHAKRVGLQQRDIQRFCAILRMYNVPSSTQVTADISEKKTESGGPMLEEERRLEVESAVITEEEAVAKKANSARAQVSSKRPRKTVRGKTPQKTYTGSKEQPQDQNSHDEHRNSHDHEEESQLDEAEDRDDNQSKTTGHSDDESSDDEEPPRDSDNDEDLSDDEISSQPEDSDDE